jgi:hypothetical protein
MGFESAGRQLCSRSTSFREILHLVRSCLKALDISWVDWEHFNNEITNI